MQFEFGCVNLTKKVALCSSNASQLTNNPTMAKCN